MSRERSEPNESYGSIRRTREKRNPNAPDFWGDCKVGGVVYKIAGWVREGQSGGKYLNLKFELKEAEADRPSGERRAVRYPV